MEGSFAIYEYETGKFLAYDTEWNNVAEAVKKVGSDWIIDHGDHAMNYEESSPGSDPFRFRFSSSSGRIHNSWIEGGRGNDIIMAGQGRDEITGGSGDDFIDGGSESDFLASFVGTTALLENKQLTDPDTGRSGVYSVYEDTSGVKWAWDGNQSTPSYFKVDCDWNRMYRSFRKQLMPIFMMHVGQLMTVRIFLEIKSGTMFQKFT